MSEWNIESFSGWCYCENLKLSHTFFPTTHNDRNTCLVSKNVTYLEEHRDSENPKYALAGGRTASNCPGESGGNGEQKGGKYEVGPWISPRATLFSPSKSIFYTCTFFKVCSRKIPRLMDLTRTGPGQNLMSHNLRGTYFWTLWTFGRLSCYSNHWLPAEHKQVCQTGPLHESVCLSVCFRADKQMHFWTHDSQLF